LRRHVTKPQASEYGRAEMSDWYRELDLLPDGIEQVIPANSPLHATVERVMNDTGLAQEGGSLRVSPAGSGVLADDQGGRLRSGADVRYG
jgi:hypothetical protein